MSIIHRKRFGAVLRIFSPKPELVAKNVEQVLAAARAAEALIIDGKPLFAKILILVASDPAYPDCDCGETLPALRKELGMSGKIEVHAIEKGDLFCVVLNYGMAKLQWAGIHYGMILSHGAKAYLRPDTIQQLLDALEAGAKVAGIAIEELAPSILEGRIANTFAIWDILALMSIGGFDMRAAQPRKDDKTAPYLRTWPPVKGDDFYPRAGVEEIIPLIRLIKVYGECIAPVVPSGEAVWKEPDRATDLEGWKRSQAKLGTKLPRQMAHAAYEHADLGFIKGGVMEQFRTF